MGTAGFLVALMGVLFSWLPGVNLILLVPGPIIFFHWHFKRPRGLAIAGFLSQFLI